jgi:hypothetical protein
MFRSPLACLLGFATVAGLAASLWSASPILPGQQEPAEKSDPKIEKLQAELASHGVQVDLNRGLIELEGAICQDREPLEYLLVTEKGKDHESLLKCRDVSAQALNTAMLLLGVEKGHNVEYVEVDPKPTEEEFEAGAPLFTVTPAHGDGFYIYVIWDRTMADGSVENFIYRAEDLVVNVAEDRRYQRGKWIYLGSRFIRPHKDAEEFFAAEGDGNLISICYFSPANQLVTGSDPAADNQYVWYPNMFLLPEIDTSVRILFSLKKLETVPMKVSLPDMAAAK